MRTRLRTSLLGVLIGVLVLALSGCASLPPFPPRLPDGSLDLVTLIDYAEYGIQADCQLGFSATLCTIGTDAIDSLRAAIRAHQGESPLALYQALRKSVIDAMASWPETAAYLRWLRDVLRAAILGLGGTIPDPAP